MAKKSVLTLIAEPIKILLIFGVIIWALVELQTIKSEVGALVFYSYVAIFVTCVISLIMTFYAKTQRIGYLFFIVSIVAYVAMTIYNSESKTVWKKYDCLQTSGHWNDEWKICVGSSAHCPPERVWNAQKKVCEPQTIFCRTNSDCLAGEYCFVHWFQNGNPSCEKEFDSHADSPRYQGVCRLAAKDRGEAKIPTGYVASIGGMNWPSAYRFCQALSMQMVGINDFQCRDEKLGHVGGTTDNICLDKVIVTKDDPSVEVIGFGDTFGHFIIWTNDADRNTCMATQISLLDGMVKQFNQLVQSGIAVCKPIK